MFSATRILVLEDEPIVGFALEDMLLEMGFPTVFLATQLAEATDIVELGRVDAAILDVNIHGKRSYPVADILAQRQVPYIFATGYGDTEHPPAHSAVPTVTKPYSIQDIRNALASALELSDRS